MISDTRGLWYADMIRPVGSAASAGQNPPQASLASSGPGGAWHQPTLAGTRHLACTSWSVVDCKVLSLDSWNCIATAALLSLVPVDVVDPRALLKILEPCEVELPPVEDGAPERLSVRTLITRWRHQCEGNILPVDCLMMAPLFVDPVLAKHRSVMWWRWVTVCAGRDCSSTWHQ